MTGLIHIYKNRDNTHSPYNFFHTENSNKCILKLAQPYIDKSKNKNTIDKKTYLHLGITTIIIAGLGVILSKGVQKHISKSLDKIKNYLEYKLEFSSMKEKYKRNNFGENIMRSITSFINKAESINNITSLRDILFMKLMFTTKPTKKIHQAISKYFDKLSIKTVVKAYKQTEKQFSIMENKFKTLDEFILKNCGKEKVTYKGKEYSAKELLEIAKSYRDEIYFSVKAFLSPEAQQKRNKYIKDVNSKLYETFWDVSFKDFATKNNKFKRKEMWQTFIAAEQMRGDKTHLADNVSILRNMISYNSEDKSIAITKQLQELKKIIPKFDNKGYNQVKKLEWFVKNGEGLKNNKDVFLKELNKLAQPCDYKNIDKKIVENLEKQKKSYVKLITDMTEETGTGQIQDLLDIYYKIAPFEFSKSGALQSVKKAVKSFDKSVNLEISEYFDKVRDLELGSAPTDVLAIILSLGLIGYDLHKAKNNDQRTSVMLTSGIPLAGGIATTILSASKLVSGGKSLALGITSGVALNIIGNSIDKYRHRNTTNNK